MDQNFTVKRTSALILSFTGWRFMGQTRHPPISRPLGAHKIKFGWRVQRVLYGGRGVTQSPVNLSEARIDFSPRIGWLRGILDLLVFNPYFLTHTTSIDIAVEFVDEESDGRWQRWAWRGFTPALVWGSCKRVYKWGFTKIDMGSMNRVYKIIWARWSDKAPNGLRAVLAWYNRN